MLEMQRLTFLSLLAFAFPAQAEVYRWREGASLKYSNIAPAWYRIDTQVRGPRVVVSEGKRVIDDTRLSIEDRRRMRPPLRAQSPARARN